MALGVGERRGLTSDTGSGAASPIGRGRHILFIAAHFAPESTSGTHRSLHFARSLHEEGFRVSVVTVDRAHLTSVDPHLDSIFPHEDRILRVPLGPTLETKYLGWKQRWLDFSHRFRSGSKAGTTGSNTRSNGALGRRRSFLRHELAGLLNFPDLFRGWYGPATAAAYRLSLADPVHAVFVSAPPWTALRVAHRVSRRLKCKLIADFRDPWTSRMGFISPDDPTWYNAWAEREEAQIIADSAAVLFNSPDLMSNAIRYGGKPTVRFHCLLNGTDVPARAQPRAFPTAEPFIVRHFGSLYGGRSIEPLIKAIGSAGELDASRVRVELIGSIEENTTRGLQAGAEVGISVQCAPAVPHSEAVQIMATPGALLVVQPREYSAQIPTKLFEYLRTGNPVLVLADEDSAVWRFASRFQRCRRLDFADVAGNRVVLEELFQQWVSGGLEQVRTDEDTASLEKSVIGREFVHLVDAVLNEGPRADPPRVR